MQVFYQISIEAHSSEDTKNGIISFEINIVTSNRFSGILLRKGVSEMTASAKYIKIVKWSDEDQCYIGYCPGVIGPCCHGDDEVEVYRELCEIVDEWIEIARQENESLPPPTIGLEIEELLRSALP